MSALREVLADFGIKFDHHAVHEAEHGIEGLVEKIERVGAAIAGAFIFHEVKEFVLGLAEQAEELELQAKAVGISTDSLQKWQFAANQAGLSSESLQTGLQKMARSIVQADKGGGDLGKTFAALHIKTKNVDGTFRTVDDILPDVADAIADMKDPTKQVGVAMDIFGRGGARLLPFLKEGKDGIAELTKQVADLGGGFDENFIEKSSELIRSTKRWDFALRGLKVAALGPLLPIITRFVEKAVSFVAKLRELNHTVNIGQTALLAFTTLGIQGLSHAIGPLGAAFGRLAGFILKSVLPLLILEDFIVFLAGGDSLIGRALDKAFGPGTQEKVRAFTDKVGESVKAFKTDTLREFFALLERDISKSEGWWAEFGAAAALAGTYAVNTLTGGWNNFFTKLAAWIDALKFNFEVVWDDIKTIGLSAAAALSDAFDGIWNSAVEGAERAVNALAAILSHVPGAGDLAKGLRGVGQDLQGSKRAGDAGEVVANDARRRQKERLAEGEDILARLAAPPPASPGSTHAPSAEAEAEPRTEHAAETTNITHVDSHDTYSTKIENKIPAGSDAEIANSIGLASQRGTQKALDLHAAKAALVHTAD